MAAPQMRFTIPSDTIRSDDDLGMDVFELESWSRNTDERVFNSAFEPGADRPRSQRPVRDPNQVVDDPELFDEQDIFESAFSDRPARYQPPIVGRRSGKE